MPLKHGETSGSKNIYLFGSDVTYDIYNYVSLRHVAYRKVINPLSCLFSRMKPCHERRCENLSLYFENGGPSESVGSRTTFRKGDIDLEDESSDYEFQTKYSIEYGSMARFLILDGLTLHCSS